MKKLFVALLTLVLIVTVCFVFTGCAKVIDIQEERVEVKIVDSDHTGAWIQPIRAGKVTTYIHHSAKYEIMVEYNGNIYTVDNKDTYNKYKDSIGECIDAVLETQIYDNGKVHYSIIELK